MSPQTLKILLNQLSPQTLARLVVELEEAREDWQFYPEQAPAKAVQNEVAQTVTLIMEIGTDKIVEADFQQLIEQARERRQAEEWPLERDRQEQQNWFEDYE